MLDKKSYYYDTEFFLGIVFAESMQEASHLG
jgi:hypothetical protein